MKKTRFWQPYYQRWLNRRIPQTQKIQLSHRSVFIVPTAAGALYIVLLLLLLITAINYQNNLLYGLTFWLFSLGLVTMMMTFRNLAGLTVIAGKAQPCFVGEKATLPIVFEPLANRHQGITLGFAQTPRLSFDGQGERTQQYLHCLAHKRGYLSVPRLRVETRFPLGLFTAWSWLKLDFQALAYPEPEFTPFVFSSGEADEESEHAPVSASGEQDFYGLREYQPGDSMRQIAWKQLAKGQGLVSKEFEQPQANSRLFVWDSLAPLPQEVRLSRLCGWVLKAHERGWAYGLSLPQQSLALDHSEAHKQQCLTALALFNRAGGWHERS